MKNKKTNFLHNRLNCLSTGGFWRLRLWLIFFAVSLNAGGNSPPPAVSEALNHYMREYPQQKVYLHTDRDVYIEGETLWFQAYVLDAYTHLPDTLSQILYVELTDREGGHLAHLSMQLLEGVSHGDILLPDSMPEGNYQLRAYTNWMRNFPKEYFFSKQIYVHNPAEKNYIRRRDIRRNKRFNRELEQQKESLVLAVFPEGGSLVAGLENRVAFRISNLLGEGLDARLSLLDEAMNEVLQTESLYHGMGYFTFTPDPGQQYHIHVQTEAAGEQRLDLPMADPQSYLLQADMNGEWLEVQVQANFRPSDFGISDESHVMLQSNGMVHHFQTVPLGEGIYRFQLPLEILTEGICQLTLFDGNHMPVAERLVFVNRGDIIDARAEGEAVQMQLQSSDPMEEEGPVKTVPAVSLHLSFDERLRGGSYSVAVLGNTEEGLPAYESIATYMLLSSELGPLPELWDESLFDDGEQQAALLDLIMMTHGWRRFDWSSLLDGKFPELSHPFLDGLSISGKMTALSSSRVPQDETVELSIQNEKTERYFTKTDDRGRFSFSELDYSGIHEAKLRAPEAVNGRNLWIEIDSYSPAKVPFHKNRHTRPNLIVERGTDWKRSKRPSLILTQIRSSPPSQQSRGFSKPDQIIYGRDVEARYDRMYELLVDQVHGLMRDERGTMFFRGKASFRQNIEPLFIINGVPGHKNSFLMVRPREIERLEVYRGTSAAIYGSRGANGALSVYTRVGDETTRYLYEFVFRGFHAPRVFQASDIQTSRYKELNVPMTLHWEPNIRVDDQAHSSIVFPRLTEEREAWVIVQGIDDTGRIINSTQRLTFSD